MATLIFIISYFSFLVLSTIYISPYFVLLWLFTSYALALLTVVIFYLLNLPIVLILSPQHRYKTYLMKSLAYFLFRCVLNIRVEIEGLENVPKEGRLVAYANHKSYTDALALMQFFPRSLALTPKTGVFKIPFLRLWLRAYNAVPINRTNPKETLRNLQAAVKTVENGQVILFYPEGSIKDRLNVLVKNAKPGSFRLVKEAKASLLPIRYEGNELVRERWPRPTKRKIKIFPPIPYEKLQDLNTIEIAKLFMDTINES